MIDADLQNRRFRRKLSPRESIDIDLSAVRPGRRRRQLLQFAFQSVGIVRKRIQVSASENHGARILFASHTDARNTVNNPYFFKVGGNLQRKVQLLHAPGPQGNSMKRQRCKSLCGDSNRIGAGSQCADGIVSVRVGSRLQNLVAMQKPDLRLGHNRSTGIHHLATQHARRRTRLRMQSQRQKKRSDHHKGSRLEDHGQYFRKRDRYTLLNDTLS